MFLTAARTSKGDGKFLSSGPWLWIASLMLYSLTNFSRRGRFWWVGAQTAMGNAGGLEVLELGTNIRIVIFVEGDVAGGGEDEAGGTIGGGLGGNLIEWNHGRVNVRLNRLGRRFELGGDHIQ
jgi:hypothetical protein